MPVVKFLYEALSDVIHGDQAAHLYEALAWSFAQSRAFDPPDLFEANGGW
ncbi:MAG: hypothetical protein IJ626_02590 [Muribaculaceae bacterium]|nr:hypothetical protein [Muribaculaceae bacterium]